MKKNKKVVYFNGYAKDIFNTYEEFLNAMITNMAKVIMFDNNIPLEDFEDIIKTFYYITVEEKLNEDIKGV